VKSFKAGLKDDEDETTTAAPPPTITAQRSDVGPATAGAAVTPEAKKDEPAKF
jgi:hypothetical protein